MFHITQLFFGYFISRYGKVDVIYPKKRTFIWHKNPSPKIDPWFVAHLVAHPTDRKWVTTLVVNGISGGNVHLWHQSQALIDPWFVAQKILRFISSAQSLLQLDFASLASERATFGFPLSSCLGHGRQDGAGTRAKKMVLWLWKMVVQLAKKGDLMMFNLQKWWLDHTGWGPPDKSWFINHYNSQ